MNAKPGAENLPTTANAPLRTMARNTATEAVRQPIHAILLLLGVSMQALHPLLAAFTLGSDDLLLLELGLSSIFLLGMFLAAFTAALALGEELRRQTVLTVLSKPISRTRLLLGKFFGISLALGCAWWVWGWSLLLSVRHGVIMTARDKIDVPVMTFGLGAIGLAIGLAAFSNWRTRVSFPARLNRNFVILAPLAALLTLSLTPEWQIQAPWTDVDGRIIGALFLLYLSMVMLGAVALAASTRLGTMATLAVTSVVFVVGMIGGTLLGDSALRFVLPNLQYLWVGDGLIRGAEPGLSVWISAAAWALTYTAAIVAIAAALFRTRDVS